MADFLVDFDVAVNQPDAAPPKTREVIRVIVIGSKTGVQETIQELHQRGFAHIDSWSKILPIPGEGQLMLSYPGSQMSILTRYRIG